jgi:hypothetical protein
MSAFRKKHVMSAVLEALAMADGYPLAADVMRSYARDLVKPPVTDEEWAAVLVEMENGKFITRVPSKFDDELVQFTIAERGEALRQSQG